MKVATTKISSQWHTVVPAPVRTGLKLDRLDELDWFVEDGKVYVAKKESSR